MNVCVEDVFPLILLYGSEGCMGGGGEGLGNPHTEVYVVAPHILQSLVYNELNSSSDLKAKVKK